MGTKWKKVSKEKVNRERGKKRFECEAMRRRGERANDGALSIYLCDLLHVTGGSGTAGVRAKRRLLVLLSGLLLLADERAVQLIYDLLPWLVRVRVLVLLLCWV